MNVLNKIKLNFDKSLCLLAVLIMCGMLCGGRAMAQDQQPQGPDPAENRAAFLNFLQGSLESGFMDEWRGKRPMKTMNDVGEYLSTFNLWAYACQDAPKFDLTENETKLLRDFRRKAESVQAEAFPKLRDNFGPVLRQQISQVEVTARTIGDGFKNVEFAGQAFNAAANIDQFHEQVKIVLFQLRFVKADYKLTFKSGVLRSVPVGTFKDTDMIVWLNDLDYELIP